MNMKNIKTYRESLMESEEKIGLLNARLRWAVEDDNLEKAIDALDRGADVNGKTNYGEKAMLHIASSLNRIEIMKLLIERGARLDVRDENGATPLHLAARSASQDGISILLDAGAPIDPTNIAGSTPLKYAKDAYSWWTCRFLIERGADPFKAFDGPEEIIEFFKGDIEWMPEQTKSKLKRMKRGKQAFGM